MGTKRKSSEGAVKKTAAKLPPKRKVAVRPAAAEPVEKPKAAKPRKAAATVEKVKSVSEIIAPISTDAIALRAYFISKQRAVEGRAGDSLSDWLEAERQLISER